MKLNEVASKVKWTEVLRGLIRGLNSPLIKIKTSRRNLPNKPSEKIIRKYSQSHLRQQLPMNDDRNEHIQQTKIITETYQERSQFLQIRKHRKK